MIDIDQNKYREAAITLGVTNSNLPVITIQGSGRLFLGSHWPNSLARLRFPRINNGGKNVIRIAKGGSSSTERRNVTLAHELIHESQSFTNKLVGKISEYIIAGIIGYVVCRTVGGNGYEDILVRLVGLTIGLRVGWILAPHEREARRLAPDLALKYKMVIEIES